MLAASETGEESPQAILRWAIEAYQGRIVLACSFSGPTGMVALDMAMEIDRSLPVYVLDTCLLFPQTYALVERTAERYGIEPIFVRATISLEEQERRYGAALWDRDPDACCRLRKVEPQREFLRGYSAWITGIRRDQTPERGRLRPVAWDETFDIVKIAPFAGWDEAQVWSYVREHDLPYNELHDAGYPSIGCIPCTRAVGATGNLRDGRWPGRCKTECGLHVR
jgi:phosphoadenosine phosphosulfate reductase